MGDVVREVTNHTQNLGNMLGNATGYNQYKPDGGAFNPNQDEMNLVQRLTAMAQGQGGPSPAELQLQQGMNQVSQNAASMAASQRGVSPALAARLAQQYAGQAGTQTNQQAGILRAQEQMGANQTLGNLFASQRDSRSKGEMANMGAFDTSADRGAAMFNAAGSAVAKGATGGMYQGGAVIPGMAKAPGDHPMNDTVPAMLSPGEIVVPRSVAQMPPEKIAAFVKAIQAKGQKNV